MPIATIDKDGKLSNEFIVQSLAISNKLEARGERKLKATVAFFASRRKKRKPQPDQV